MLAAWLIDAAYQAIGGDLFGRDDLRHALSARDDRMKQRSSRSSS
jgi:hypothetical protein